MSGVYVKGMEMPCEEAEPLRIELYADGTVIVIREQDDFYEFKAVHVPPHGRLIDADLIMEKLKESCRTAFGDDGDIPECSGLSIVADYIEPAPTVIPASEEGE